MRMRSWGESWQSLRDSVMSTNSAWFIVCLFGCDLRSMCVVLRVMGLTIDAPGGELPVFGDPSVYMKSLGFHAA